MLTRKSTALLARSHLGMLQQCFGYAKPATGGNESTGSLDGKMQLMMKALQRQEVKDVKMTAEELAEAARRAKEYSRLKMHEERQWQADLSTKLKLKLAAVAALPPHLREAAMVPDMSPIPSNRRVFTETPPHDEDSADAKPRQQTRSKRSIGTKRR